MTPTKKRTKLTLSEVKTRMEVLTKEDILIGTNVYSGLGSFLEEYKLRENKVYDYSRFVHIDTFLSEDILANQVAHQHANSNDYSIFGSSCVDVPQEVIKAIYGKRYGSMGSFITSMSSNILIPREYLYGLKAFYGDEMTS